MNPWMAWMALACSLATGAAWVSVLWRRPRPTFHERCVRAAAAVAVGLALSAAVQFVYLVIGRVQPHAFMFADTAMLAIALAVRSRQRRGERKAAREKAREKNKPDGDAPSQAGNAPEPVVRLPWAPRVLLPVAALLVAFAALTAVAARLHNLPMGEYDAVSMWNARARFILQAGEHWRDAFAVSVHADYPLLLQLNIARLWRYLGAESPLVPQGLALLFTAATLAMVHGTTAILRGRALAAGALAAVAGTTLFLHIASLQYADLPFGFFVTGTVCLLALSAARGGGLGVLALAGCCAGAAVFTKNEGSPVLLAAALAVTLIPPMPVDSQAQPVSTGRVAWKARGLPLIVFLLGAAPLVGVRMWQKRELPAGNDLIEGQSVAESLARVVDFERHAEIFRAAWRLLLNPPWHASQANSVGYAVMPMFIAAALLLGRSKEPSLTAPLRRVALVCAALAGVYYVVYLLTPHELYWHLETSLQRLYVHMLPSLALLVALAARSPEDAMHDPPPG